MKAMKTIPWYVWVGAVIIITAGVAFVLFSKYSKRPEEYPKVISGPESATCRVVVYSPSYIDPRRAATVTIKWDNVIVFSGQLPSADPDTARFGMPLHLLEIHTTAGSHGLEVKHGTNLKKVQVILLENGKHYFMIFGIEEGGKKVLIEDMGENPMLA